MNWNLTGTTKLLLCLRYSNFQEINIFKKYRVNSCSYLDVELYNRKTSKEGNAKTLGSRVNCKLCGEKNQNWSNWSHNSKGFSIYFITLKLAKRKVQKLLKIITGIFHELLPKSCFGNWKPKRSWFYFWFIWG